MYRAAPRFLLLQHGPRIVHLTRERVHELLVSQNQAFMQLQAMGAPEESAIVPVHARSIPPAILRGLDGQLKDSNKLKHTIHVSAAKWERPNNLCVFRPAAPEQWALQALPTRDHREFYQVGPWVLRQGSEDYYFGVEGSAHNPREIGGALFDMQTGREVVPDHYAGLWSHVQESLAGRVRGRGISELVRSMLRGDTPADVPASLAVITAAMFIAEVRRRHESHAINLICLDLIDRGTLTWDNLMADGRHPVARGGGKEITAETFKMETDLAVQWLVERSLPKVAEFEADDTPLGDPAGPADEALVAGLFRKRMASLGDANQSQLWVLQHAEPTAPSK